MLLRRWPDPKASKPTLESVNPAHVNGLPWASLWAGDDLGSLGGSTKHGHGREVGIGPTTHEFISFRVVCSVVQPLCRLIALKYKPRRS